MAEMVMLEMETFQRVMGAFPCRHPTPSNPSAAAAAAATPDPDGVDRISNLPDDNLRDVVSRLPVRDAARTAVLATRWRGLWRAAPLVLRDADLLVSSSSDEQERQRPDAAVGRILADHPGPFSKVSLTYCSFTSRERELGEWARLLVDKGVHDLVLFDNPPLLSSSVLRFPADILRCASLRRLFLGLCTFPETMGAPRGPDVFPHLKEFSMLTGNMSEHDLEYMLACSPKLETLALIISRMPKRIRLHGQSLRCMLLWSGLADELAVVDAPHLDRLILWGTCGAGDGGRMTLTLKIDRAPELRVLGQLHPKLHQLQIGKTIINAQTKASPSCSVPSVKILALQLNFAVFKDVSMVTSFLRCFPNIETLHIQSSRDGQATGWHNTKFWQEVHPIKCVKSHVKTIVIREFQGEQSEYGFIKFIAKRARKLQVLVLMLTKEKFDSADVVDEVHRQLGAVTKGSWAAELCQVLLLGPKLDYSWSFSKASDLSVKDPFW